MQYITLQEIKAQLNIESSWTADDTYLGHLGDVAEEALEGELCRELSDMEDAQGHIPATLKHAMLLLIGEWYACREDVTSNSTNRIPHGVRFLVSKYRDYNG